MFFKILSIVILLVAIGGVVVLSKKQKHTTSVLPAVQTPPPRKVYVGSWVTDFWDNDTKTLKANNLLNFEKQIDKKMALANIYSEWQYLANPELLNALREISANKWTPIISANPAFFEGCPKNSESIYKEIAKGNCDQFLKEAAINLRTFGSPIMLRFAWEMNLPSMYWSIKSTKSKPEDFVNAWRQMHKIFEKEGASNVLWVLSFNTTGSNTVPYGELYPGYDYVDWVAIDGYNWGTAQPWSKWTSFNGVFRKSYDELAVVSNEPVMLSEVNSAPDGGDKAKWLEDMLHTQIPNEYPKVEAIVLFNENKTEGESVDWRMEKSTSYLEAVSEGLKSNLYHSTYP